MSKQKKPLTEAEQVAAIITAKGTHFAFDAAAQFLADDYRAKIGTGSFVDQSAIAERFARALHRTWGRSMSVANIRSHILEKAASKIT